jgi:hypothetical protein
MGIWLTELRRNLPPDIILHVVGTKADLVAKNPSFREVPFERCIAYVAENLAPGMSSTPPATATAGGVMEGGTAGSSGSGGMYYRGFFQQRDSGKDGNGGQANAMDGARSPSSKRSSGFWGQEVGWDCCHEVSAESGEGVEEVFRVITRKLVEQNRKLQEQLQSAAQTPGLSPGMDGSDGSYFDAIMRPGGSFRVGRDRRSWFGVPVENYLDGGDVNGQAGQGQSKPPKKCC